MMNIFGTKNPELVAAVEQAMSRGKVRALWGDLDPAERVNAILEAEMRGDSLRELMNPPAPPRLPNAKLGALKKPIRLPDESPRKNGRAARLKRKVSKRNNSGE